MTTEKDSLNALIRDEISATGGIISFSRFMQLALYHPQLGYYNNAGFSIGHSGDFTTAPQISPLFAYCYVTPCIQILDCFKEKHLLELGAGTGKFAGDLLTELAKKDVYPTYSIYEISPGLRQKQQAFLKTHYPNVIKQITWLDALPLHFKGVILANEVIDALPVTCFRLEKNTILERGVGFSGSEFCWQTCKPLHPELEQKVNHLRHKYDLYPGYESEINLSLPSFLNEISLSLQEGVILFSDYGYGQQEYYHPERNQGTLACFYQHHYHHNPFTHVGKQDMTAHVDFTYVIETATDFDCSLLGYTSQSAFLLNCGLLDYVQFLEKNLSEKGRFELHQAVKLLTLPTEMGERVKMMALAKNFKLQLRGFDTVDKRREL